jgi:hypothetical protein
MASVAYGPEAIVLGLASAGAHGLGFTLPVTLAIAGMLAVLVASYRQEKYNIDEELRRYLRDVADHATHVTERVEGFKQAPSPTTCPNIYGTSPTTTS